MKDILKDNYFSIEFFNEYGLEEVSEVTGADFDEVQYEFETGNFLVGQTHNGKFYFFCESDVPNNEITFNAFKRLADAK